MAVITYLIRMIPMTLFRKKIRSRFIKSVLYYIPYSVLSAMTFPSVFYSTGDVPSAVVGTIVALILAFFKCFNDGIYVRRRCYEVYIVSAFFLQ
jgi:branched-subunit amino acid transport protein